MKISIEIDGREVSVEDSEIVSLSNTQSLLIGVLISAGFHHDNVMGMFDI
jgi:hypothetical protein